MKFGYFDDIRKEYVITTPQTPLPWINYLGCENFFSLISNTCATATTMFLVTATAITSISMKAVLSGTRPGSPPERRWIPIPAATALATVFLNLPKMG